MRSDVPSHARVDPGSPPAEDVDAGRLAEWRFADALEHSGIGTALVSLEGRWLRVNASLQRLLGYSAAELSKLTFQDITHPDDLATDLAHLDELLAGKTLSYQMEKRYIRKDGGEIWILLSVSLVRDEAGQPLYFVSQIQDISERKADEFERLRLTERLTLATRASGVAVWEWDLATDELIWDDNINMLLGLPAGTGPPTHETYIQALHPDDRDRAVAEMRAAAVNATPLDVECRIVHPNGQIRYIRALATVVSDPQGAALRMVGATWDLTEMRQLHADALAASEAKSQFLATMSHEIRTPLNGVLGMAQAMAAYPLSADQRARLDVIRDSGQSLLAILNDILDLSKVEAGQLVLEAVNFDLGRLLAGAHATFSSIADDKGLRFTLDLGDAAGTYCGDPTRVRQVVSNLISNALKFTTDGEVRITAHLGDSGLLIAVSDSGMGVPQQALTAIFNTFTQADATITRTHGGTGLGLAISRRLARLMGGDIAVESQKGAGSIFTLHLPMLPIAGRAVEDEAAVLDEDAHQDLKILVAEDNAVNRLVIKALLAQIGVEPVLVENGAEAVEAWRREDWDVILMDVQMPVMDGIAATRRIREEEVMRGSGRTPIIALTANAMPHHVDEYRQVGMDGFVPKPIDVRMLLTALQRVLDASADEVGLDAATG
jgi:PAS domain S-box-containing protein